MSTPYPQLLRAANRKIDEADVIRKAAEAESRHLTDEESKRIFALLDEARDLDTRAHERRGDGIVPSYRTIDEARAQRSGTLPRHADPDMYADADGPAVPRLPLQALQRQGRASGLTFRDGDGRLVRALLPSDQLAAAEPMRFDHEELREGLGELVRGLSTGQAQFDAPHVQAAIGGIDPSGGYLLSPAVSASVVDLARSASVVVKAGAQTVPVPGAELTLVSVTKDPTAQWRHEGVAVTASSPDFGRITLKPKTLAAIIPISLELLEDSANFASLFEESLTAALGLALDLACLVGKGSGAEPLGIRNHPSVNTVTSVGTPSDYSKYSSAVEKILSANFAGEISSLAWIGNPRDFAKLDVLEDSTGQPLNATPWTAQLRKLSTTSLPTNEGGGTNESVAIIGSFPDVVIGARTSGVVIRVVDAGSVVDSDGATHNAASELKRLIIAHLRADVAILRPKFMTVLSGITVS